MKEKLITAVGFIEANRKEMGDKKSLNMLLKALDRLIKEDK
ncbi:MULTISPECIES: hypothetical protein [Bacillus]|nr:hypothetical protein [Bacillus pumilus]